MKLANHLLPPTPLNKKLYLRLATGAVIFLLAGGGVYFGWKLFTKKPDWQPTRITEAAAAPNATPTPPVFISPVDTGEWQTRTSQAYGFALKYPHDWVTGLTDREHADSLFTLASPTTAQSLKKKGTHGDVDLAVRMLRYTSFDQLEQKLQSQSAPIAHKTHSIINGTDVLAMTVGANGSTSLYLYLQHQGKLISIIFYKAASLESLGDVEKGILSTIQTNL